jgi:hypothetical protein
MTILVLPVLEGSVAVMANSKTVVTLVPLSPSSVLLAIADQAATLFDQLREGHAFQE